MGVATNLLQTNAPDQAPTSLFSKIVTDSAMIESDPLAAIPSLHAAYITLFCFFTMRLRILYGLISIPLTVGVLFSTVYLGQHYLIDLAAGAAVAVLATYASTQITRRQANLVRQDSCATIGRFSQEKQSSGIGRQSQALEPLLNSV